MKKKKNEKKNISYLEIIAIILITFFMKYQIWTDLIANLIW